MRLSFVAALRAALLVAGLGAAAISPVGLGNVAKAHEGHDHAEEAKGAPAATAPRGSSSSAELELVAVARAGALTIYVDRVATNEPVTNATIDAETPDGTAKAVPMPDGSYRLEAHWIEKPGDYDLLFTVSVPGGKSTASSDIFPVNLVIPEPAASERGGGWAAGLAVAHDVVDHLRKPDPVLFVIAGVAFLLGVLACLFVRRGARGSTLAVMLCAGAAGALLLAPVPAWAHGDHGETAAAPATPGARDVSQRLPDGAVFMPKPTQRLLGIRTQLTADATLDRVSELPGRIIADPNASGVVQSSVGGRLSPPASGAFPRLGTRVNKGDVLAYVTPPIQAVDLSDMRQRQGELDQQIAIVQRRVSRFEKLAPGGSISQVQLDEALAELIGLKDRRAALDNVRQQPEALIAPVSGVVAEANAVAGQMAAPGTMVFQIVDPSRLWVEALSFEALPLAGAATARLADGRSLALSYRGSGLADRSQAVPVQFAISGQPADLRIGQFVTVLAGTGEQVRGLALPRAAVVRAANGQNLIYEHVAPERFEPREVQVEPLDAERVRVVSGLGAGKDAGASPGRRVVTKGAELINQVR